MEEITFIINLIDFYCSMCADRNYTWKTFLEKDLTNNILVKILDKDMIIDIKARIVKLLTTMFIDQEPRQRNEVPVKCKIVELKK